MNPLVSSTPNKRGWFIVLEGCDRTGKTTQCERLTKRLSEERNGNVSTYPCVNIKFPDRTTAIGKIIDSVLRKDMALPPKALHLLFSANRWELQESICNYLNNGVTVVCDRYSYSGIAFSTAKGLDFEWCKQSDVGLPCPDIVFYLDTSSDKNATRKREGFGQEMHELQEFQSKVEKEYARFNNSDRWVSVDATQSIDDVHHQIYRTIIRMIRVNQLGPIKPLFVDPSEFTNPYI